jgi:Fe-S-cluster-containing dehydrogenase component
MGNHLADDEYRITVRTNGSGVGIDRPAGVYPDLNMNWMPIYKQSCTFCPARVAEGEDPLCAHNCPTFALAFGDDADPESAFSKELARVKDKHYHIFELPAYEDSRANIVYATKA